MYLVQIHSYCWLLEYYPIIFIYLYVFDYFFTIFLFNFGPQHPSTHGVLRLIPILHGEIIKWITPEIGLLHRGTEKLIECNYYISSIPYSNRLDYVSTITQEPLFIQIIERFIDCYCYSFIPLRRTLLLEFYRTLNHSLNITTHAIDTGLSTTMLWTFEEREKLINSIEVLSGTRFILSFLYILLVLILSLIFSINLCGTISSSTSNNFECGFYSNSYLQLILCLLIIIFVFFE